MIPSDEITAPWWEQTRLRRLTVQQCESCSRLQHYPRALCTGCGSFSLSLVPVSGLGTVDSFTVVHRSPTGEPTPYTVARVRLDEGPVLLTRLVGPGPWTCDQPVRLDWLALADGRHLPVFGSTTGPLTGSLAGSPTQASTEEH